MTKRPVKKVAQICFFSIILVELISGFSYLNLGNRIFFHIFATGLMVLYHVLIRALTPRFVMLVHKKPFNPDNFCFRGRSFEKSLYKFFKVKKWKDKLITVEPEAFSPKTNSPEGILEMMCIAEVIHTLLFFWSLCFILFGFIFGKFWIFIPVASLSGAWELRFVMAQRFNRPRVKKLLQKKNHPCVAIIAARSRNNVIGKDGRIPWNIEGEKQQFKELTSGNVVVMGRKTYEEIGHPLPERKTIVVSQTTKFEGENLSTASSVKEAIKMAGRRKVFIAGGYGVYKEALPYADLMYITEINTEIADGDVFFPDFDIKDFNIFTGESGGSDIKYTRTKYIRKNKAAQENR